MDLENLTARVLRVGVLFSTVAISLGVLLSPFKIGLYPGCLSTLQVCSTDFGEPASSMGGLVVGLESLDPVSIIELGVLALLAIPFLRVVLGAIMYAKDRNWTYVGISAVILAVLSISVLLVAPLEAWG